MRLPVAAERFPHLVGYKAYPDLRRGKIPAHTLSKTHAVIRRIRESDDRARLLDPQDGGVVRTGMLDKHREDVGHEIGKIGRCTGFRCQAVVSRENGALCQTKVRRRIEIMDEPAERPAVLVAADVHIEKVRETAETDEFDIVIGIGCVLYDHSGEMAGTHPCRSILDLSFYLEVARTPCKRHHK